MKKIFFSIAIVGGFQQMYALDGQHRNILMELSGMQGYSPEREYIKDSLREICHFSSFDDLQKEDAWHFILRQAFVGTKCEEFIEKAAKVYGIGDAYAKAVREAEQNRPLDPYDKAQSEYDMKFFPAPTATANAYNMNKPVDSMNTPLDPAEKAEKERAMNGGK